jgi:hypothetical protein
LWKTSTLVRPYLKSPLPTAWRDANVTHLSHREPGSTLWLNTYLNAYWVGPDPGLIFFVSHLILLLLATLISCHTKSWAWQRPAPRGETPAIRTWICFLIGRLQCLHKGETSIGRNTITNGYDFCFYCVAPVSTIKEECRSKVLSVYPVSK